MAFKIITKTFPLWLLGLLSCGSGAELSTVSDLDLKKYMGTWYEIQRFPHRFEKNLQCVSATYSLRSDGSITVYNKGFNPKKDKWQDITGSAKVTNPQKPGEIKVTFFRPFSGNYFVIDIDKDYQTALIGSPSRKYLWILSRSKQVDNNQITFLRNLAKEKGFDIGKLEIVGHVCE